MDEEHPFTVNSLFARHWERFKEENKHNLRPVEIQEVEKMLSCKDESRGFWKCYCRKCNEYHNVYLGCNSRLCSHCGKRYADKWAESMAINTFDVPHRHVVLGLPPALWDELRKERKAWKTLMDSAMELIRWLYRVYCGNVTAGAILILHTFGRDMGFKPHIHGIVTSGGFDKQGKFKECRRMPPYKSLGRKWMYIVCRALRKRFPNTARYRGLFNTLWLKYGKSGFIAKICGPCLQNKNQIGKYIARYVRHPAIADSRIISFDDKFITFCYLDHKTKRLTAKIMKIDEFMLSLLQHIPDKQFKMIRYYGVYARRIKGRYLHESIRLPDLNGLQISARLICPKCGFTLKKVSFIRNKPG